MDANKTRIMIKFNKPVTYGHWANIVFAARGVDHNITVVPDKESGK